MKTQAKNSNKVAKVQVLQFYFTRDALGNKIQKPILYGGIPNSTGFHKVG